MIHLQAITRALCLLAAAAFVISAQAQAQRGQNAPQASPEEQFRQLLLSGAWCTFRYNKVSGASSSTRYHFAANGTYSGGSQSESYSSGRNGSVAGQTNSTRGGRWAIQNGAFYMAEGADMLQRVEVSVKHNSAGHPIIVGGGIEYSRC